MKTKIGILFIVASVLLAACAGPSATATNPPPVSTQPSPTATTSAYPPPPVPTAVVPTSVGAYPSPQVTPTKLPVDLTPAQMAAVQALAKKYNLPVEAIQVVSTEAVTWPDGCLGVVLPGVMCTDVITPGFRIIMQANGQSYEFHTNQDGSSVLDAAQLQATLRFVVQTADRTVQVVNPSIPLGPTYNPAFNGFLPAGGSIAGTAYVLDLTNVAKVVAIDASGSKDLTFIQNFTYSLAIWRGGLGTQSMLAWGTQATNTERTTSLQIASPDGSNLQTLLTIDTGANFPIALVAQLWSADGQSLYFSKEPVGLGGYILYSGASNLYKIDIKTKEVTEIIPQAASTSPQICLDAISGDYRYVADHCTQKVITIRDLQGGGTTTIQAPADVTGYQLMGSARFSPTGDRVAFSLAQGDPNNERGWVAVGDRAGGTAKLVLVGDAGSYYTVLGWMDDQTLLVQSNPVMCTSGTCSAQLFTVGADGSNLTKVADGSLLTVLDNR